MLLDRREYKRFDIPLFIEIKRSKSDYYSVGLTRNISNSGFSVVFHNHDLNPGEILTCILKQPRGSVTVSFLGCVIWKEENNSRYVAGIKLGKMDKKTRKNFLEILSESAQVPAGSFRKAEGHNKEKGKERGKKSSAKLRIRKTQH